MRCVIIGLDHDIQGVDTKDHDVEKCLTGVLDGDPEIALIADEQSPQIDRETVARRIASKRGIRWAAIDMPHEIKQQHGIVEALADRWGFDDHRNVMFGFYLDHEDGIREKYWISQIMQDGAESVVVVCGVLHLEPLAAKMSALGWEVRQVNLCDEEFYRRAHPTFKLIRTADGRRGYETAEWHEETF